MKKRSRLAVSLFLAVFVLGGFLWQESARAEKTAFVDLALLFDGYDKTKDFDTNLQDVQDKKQKDIDKKVEEIKGLQDKLPLLADKEKENKQDEIDKKTKDLQEFQRSAELDLRKERDEKLKEILKDIQDVVETVAKQKGYDFILNEKMILYGNKSLDITKDVLKIVNDNYKNKKK